jgi:PIN domain nuclease of toxin-antitoxin system
MSAVVLDTHVLHWWSAEPSRVSPHAADVITAASELVVADVSWLELALLAHRNRIAVSIPIGSWLERLARMVRSVPISPEIAAAAVTLPETFPGDRADRLIFATAAANGWPLVSKDGAFSRLKNDSVEVIW